MERTEFLYDKKARDAGCCVISGAGFDSIPADVGCLWTQRKFGPAGVPASVESYVTMHCQRRLQGNTSHSMTLGAASPQQLCGKVIIPTTYIALDKQMVRAALLYYTR